MLNGDDDKCSVPDFAGGLNSHSGRAEYLQYGLTHRLEFKDRRSQLEEALGVEVQTAHAFTLQAFQNHIQLQSPQVAAELLSTVATLDHMASHGDRTMSARLIISESDSPSELLWFLGHGKGRIHIATASYPAGVVMALVYKVNSFFLEPELEHQSRE